MRWIILLAVFAGSAVGHRLVSSNTNLSVVVNPSDGSYNISVSGTLWFSSGPTALHVNGKWSTTEDSSLKLKDHKTFTGTDVWGPYTGAELTWEAEGNVSFLTVFKEFRDIPVLLFSQRFPDGAPNTAVSEGSIMSSFPTIKGDGKSGERGVVTWLGGMAGSMYVGDWADVTKLPGGDHGGIPAVVFDKQMKNAVVISPASQFMAAAQSVWEGMDKTNNVGFGLLNAVTEIPKNFEYDTVFAFGVGVNDAMDFWGRGMRDRYGKDRRLRDSDFSINYVGYWTDNGACYHYDPGETNYEDTMLQVYEAAVEMNIPFRYLQLDSWWYFKGPHSGVKNWTAMPDVFPHGIEYVSNKTSWPIFAHNRWWSTETDYAKQNGGNFDFIVESDIALPVSEDFWNWLISNAKRDWHLFVYEQDWLSTTFDKLQALHENVTLGRTWLLQMGFAAERYGLTIQYCMPYTRHLLQSLEIPSVTQSRLSGDYHAGSGQWSIGDSSVFVEALGVAPFKDTFYTAPDQTACADKTSEPYPILEAAVATYATGPVGPGDHYNMTNRDVVMMTCADDGLILKPSKPLRTIDSSFTQRAFGSGGPLGQVWTTHTWIDTLQWHHVFSADLSYEYDFVPGDLLDLSSTFSDQQWVAYPHNMTSSPMPFDESHPIKLPKCDRADFGLWHIAPVFSNGWVLLGEMAKFVPISEQRILSVSADDTSITVALRGSPSEEVTVFFWKPSSTTGQLQNSVLSGQVVKYQCVIASRGVSKLSVPDGSCV